MPAPLRCPACAAPLAPSTIDGPFVRCPYCGSSARLADARAPDAPSPAPPPRVRAGAVLLLAALAAGVGVGATAMLRGDGEPAPAPAATLPSAPLRAEAEDPSAAPPAPAPAAPVVRFGREGTGAGGFTDARAVAMAADGRILVGEYGGGRVQVFDSTGRFLTQWTADARMPMRSLAVDRAGRAYVVQGGRIRRFDAATGEPLGELGAARSGGYDDVAPALDGTFWAVAGDALVRLAADGAVLARVELREAVDEDAAPGKVAVAGTGELFVTDRWTGEVYRLDPAGRFADRFGAARPGGAFAEVAVDGRGRVYLSGMDGIRVFDRTGTELGRLGEGGVVFGMAVDDERGLLAAAFRNAAEVRVFRLPP